MYVPKDNCIDFDVPHGVATLLCPPKTASEKKNRD